jgi:lysophospholipase
MEYSIAERDDMIANGYNVVTMGNGTREGHIGWSKCVGCAILSRSFDRTGTDVPSVCKACFEKYCWDGTLNNTESASYEPIPIMAKSSASRIGASYLLVLAVLSALGFALT